VGANVVVGRRYEGYRNHANNHVNERHGIRALLSGTDSRPRATRSEILPISFPNCNFNQRIKICCEYCSTETIRILGDEFTQRLPCLGSVPSPRRSREPGGRPLMRSLGLSRHLGTQGRPHVLREQLFSLSRCGCLSQSALQK